MSMSLLEEKVSNFILQDLDPADLANGNSKSSSDSVSRLLTPNLSQSSLNGGSENLGCRPISKKLTKVNLWQYLIEYHRRELDQDSLGFGNKHSIDKVFRKKDPKRYIQVKT
jgi:hypothetical protein